MDFSSSNSTTVVAILAALILLRITAVVPLAVVRSGSYYCQKMKVVGSRWDREGCPMQKQIANGKASSVVTLITVISKLTPSGK